MKKTAAILAAFILAAASIVPFTATAVSSQQSGASVTKYTVSNRDTNLYPIEVIKLVNKERAKVGQPPLKLLPELIIASDIRAKETIQRWDHIRPDGRSGLSVVDDFGLDWHHLGENIAAGQTDPDDVMKSWMNSTDHRNNILSPNFQYIGVGVAESGGALYWTQVFMGSSANFPVSYYPESYGDTNNDGRVDSVDASLVLQEYAALSVGKPYTLSSSERARSQLSPDTNVDSIDASMILRMYAINSSS